MEKAHLRALVSAGISAWEISRRVGKSHPTIRYWLKKHGLTKELAWHKVDRRRRQSCRTCERKFLYTRSAGHRYGECNTCGSYKRRTKIKQKLVDLKGGACVYCGYDKHLSALQFHHTKGKDFILARNYNRKFSLLVKEVAKCILLCANCHSAVHAKDAKLTGRVPL